VWTISAGPSSARGCAPYVVTYTGYYLVENLTNYRRPKAKRRR
jgi:hypothetical protein